MKKVAMLIFFVFMMIVMASLVVFGTISVNAQNRTKDVKEWLLLRGNEEAYKGKIVTWKCVYYDVDLGRRGGWNFGAVSRFRLKDDLQKIVHVDGGCSIYPEPGRQEGSIDAWRMIKKLREGDLLEITGKFLGVEEFHYHTGI